MKTIVGQFEGRGRRFGIVVGRFNETISSRLLGACVDTLERHGVDSADIHVVWVPGAFEVPVTAQRLSQSQRYDAVICLGAVIRGQTPHFDHVAGQSAAGIARAALKTGRPILYGILTTDTTDQALERSGIKAGNKGADAAMAALEMADLFSKLKLEGDPFEA